MDQTSDGLQPLSRKEFRRRILERDSGVCVICGAKNSLVAHHLIERRVFRDGGYYENNGVTLCLSCHLRAKETILSVEALREAAGIQDVYLPDGVFADESYTKWLDVIHKDRHRSPGPLFRDFFVQKVLARGGVLDLYIERYKLPHILHAPDSPNRDLDEDKTLADYSAFLGQDVVISVNLGRPGRAKPIPLWDSAALHK